MPSNCTEEERKEAIRQTKHRSYRKSVQMRLFPNSTATTPFKSPLLYREGHWKMNERKSRERHVHTYIVPTSWLNMQLTHIAGQQLRLQCWQVLVQQVHWSQSLHQIILGLLLMALWELWRCPRVLPILSRVYTAIILMVVHTQLLGWMMCTLYYLFWMTVQVATSWRMMLTVSFNFQNHPYSHSCVRFLMHNFSPRTTLIPPPF